MRFVYPLYIFIRVLTGPIAYIARAALAISVKFLNQIKCSLLEDSKYSFPAQAGFVL